MKVQNGEIKKKKIKKGKKKTTKIKNISTKILGEIQVHDLVILSWIPDHRQMLALCSSNKRFADLCKGETQNLLYEMRRENFFPPYSDLNLESISPKEKYLDLDELADQKLLSEAVLKQTWMLKAAARGSIKDLKTILASLKRTISQDDLDNILFIAAENGQNNIIDFLIGIGADLHADNDEALSRAAENGYLETVQHLVEKGASFQNPNDENSALRSAVMTDYEGIVKYLLEKGFPVEPNSDLALYDGINSGYADDDIIEMLLEAGARLDNEQLESLEYNVTAPIWNLLMEYHPVYAANQ